MELNKIYNEDCLIGLKSIPDNSVDLVVTDPPYKITQRGNYGTFGGMMKNELSMKGKVFEHNCIEIEDYLPHLYRILKEDTHCYIMCNHVNLMHFLEVIGKSDFHFVKCLIWDKCNKICCRFYMNAFEYIIMLRRGGQRQVNDCGIGDILKVANDKDKGKDGGNIHDSQKPTKLFEILINQSTNKGDVVLDPFMGSGTTALACLNTDRKFIGYELDEKYYNLCQKRIKNNNRQLSLF